MNFPFTDELDNKEIVTYSDMYEEVKRYAAAFRKNGLTKGDRVACKFIKFHVIQNYKID